MPNLMPLSSENVWSLVTLRALTIIMAHLGLLLQVRIRNCLLLRFLYKVCSDCPTHGVYFALNLLGY